MKANWKDPNWKYVNSASTDGEYLRKKFKKIMSEQAKVKPPKIVRVKYEKSLLGIS
jgi:hypothetical protein